MILDGDVRVQGIAEPREREPCVVERPLLDGAPDQLADPFVREIVGDLEEAGGSLATASDGARVITRPTQLLAGGGASQRRRIASPSPDSDVYDANTQVMRLDEPLDPVPPAGVPWRIAAPLAATGSPEGRQSVYVWDSAQIPDPDRVQIKLTFQDLGSRASALTPVRAYTPRFDLPSPLGSEHLGMAVGDLDGDGDNDLVCKSSSGDTAVLFFQVAPGEFEPGSSSLAVGPFTDVALGDLDRDEDNDLVFARNGSLQVFLQSAPGEFEAVEAPLQVGGFVPSVALGDLDGDGDNDLVAAARDSNGLAVFFQETPGEFVGLGELLDVGERPWSVALGDLDGDGDNDLASANITGNDVTMLFQVTPGKFELQGASLPAATPWSLALGDLDGDGDTDLAIATLTGLGSGLKVFFQVAPGEFETGPVLPTEASAFSVALGDLDADGDNDLVAASRTRGDIPVSYLSVFYQTSSGVFEEAGGSLPVNDPSVRLGDLDGDGDIDLLSQDTQGLAVFLQVAPNAFEPTGQRLPGGPGVALGDVDGDGDNEIVSNSEDGIAVHFQVAPGEFKDSGSALPGVGSIALGDVDGDGNTDLVSNSNQGNGLTLFLQVAPGEFEVVTLGFAGGNPAIGDLDGDGDVDLAWTDNAFLRLMFQIAPGQFEAGTTPLTAGMRPTSVAIGDLDGDGDNDLVSGDGGPLFDEVDCVRVFFQVAPGQFEAAEPLAAGDFPGSVAIGDLDDDGDNDFVAANTLSDDLTLFFQVAPGEFEAAVATLGTGKHPTSVALGDLDADGDNDLVTANQNSDDLTVFFQVAPGEFVANAASLVTPPRPRAVAIGDLDGDGDNDVMSAGSEELTVFFQMD